MEIQQGLLSSQQASKHCLCFMRNVTNLEDHVTSRRAQKYLDTVRVTGETMVCNKRCFITPTAERHSHVTHQQQFHNVIKLCPMG